MRNAEPDAGELLVKALDLAVGASDLARYAATHTADARLRRLFRQFASSSEHQERVLREQLGRTAGEAGRPGGRLVATYVALGLAAAAALGVGLAIAARIRGGTPGPSDRSAGRPPGTSGRGIFGGSDGAVGPGRGVSTARGAGY
jgi:hypothetical protein